jgi:hypothetical protein
MIEVAKRLQNVVNITSQKTKRINLFKSQGKPIINLGLKPRYGSNQKQFHVLETF